MLITPQTTATLMSRHTSNTGSAFQLYLVLSLRLQKLLKNDKNPLRMTEYITAYIAIISWVSGILSRRLGRNVLYATNSVAIEAIRSARLFYWKKTAMLMRHRKKVGTTIGRSTWSGFLTNLIWNMVLL